MKKFTKGCLITALVLFVFGCAFYGICGLLGGFRQLEAWKGRGFNLWGHDIRLASSGYGFWYLTDEDESWRDEEGQPEMMADANRLSAGEAEQTGYHASGIRDIDIEFGGSNLVIAESEDDYIWVARDDEARMVRYQLKGGTFSLYSENSFRWWNGSPKGTVYLYLPEGMDLDSFDLEIGAGRMDSIALTADEINIEMDAGAAVIEGLYGDEIDVSANAGTVEVYELTAGTLSAEAGAGALDIRGLSAEKTELSAAAGSLNIEGKVGRSADIECGAGSISMKLQGAETDYNYQLECAMGEININGAKYSGIIDERDIRNGGRGLFEIECAAGGVEIQFTE
ncbi:MAG: DUF4097 domain-containing protein [Blautia sp.]|nr:DUF4097 domain-containing protein [Blautia sp.]MCM1200702.1 DUF4097 domain-containing protein [Bacteroides fragilis]